MSDPDPVTDARAGGLGDEEAAGRSFARLVALMRRLRGPDGCPWDRQQTLASLRRYTLEEAYEVVEAIEEGDPTALRGELGDLLLQVVFLAQICTEREWFDVAAVADAIVDKLVRRHPHVFGRARAADAREVVERWERIKHAERGGGSLLDDVGRGLPALERADKLGRRAARIGFDWPGPREVLGKVREELDELEAALAGEAGEREEEIGDLLFALANLARHLGVSAEVALDRAGRKFERRFRALEAALGRGEIEADPVALEAAWQRLKAAERGSAGGTRGAAGEAASGPSAAPPGECRDTDADQVER